MKPIKFIIICALTCYSFWGYPQREAALGDDYGFYQRMALNDAYMEESMRFDSQEDEADYWRDQLNFEKQLKQKAYSSYKTYIFYKSKAYLSHQSECDIKVNHGRGYNRQALFYITQGMEIERAARDISRGLKPISMTMRRH